VYRQSLIGQPFQQLLGFGTAEQFRPLPLRFQFSQQEACKLILFFLMGARGLSGRLVEEAASSVFSFLI
jgi:hypothetical protein